MPSSTSEVEDRTQDDSSVLYRLIGARDTVFKDYASRARIRKRRPGHRSYTCQAIPAPDIRTSFAIDGYFLAQDLHGAMFALAREIDAKHGF
ncbi:MAG: hypothetical protein OXH07_00525 [Chloroflexi bacterium]|nr:hypothetical protein [Chloroflexota bacterium]